MHNIELMFGYYLEINDDNVGCITLRRVEHTTDKEGKRKTADKAVGYYSTFGGALMGLRRKIIKHRLAQGEGLKLDQAIEQIKALDAEIKRLIVDGGIDCGESKLI